MPTTADIQRAIEQRQIMEAHAKAGLAPFNPLQLPQNVGTPTMIPQEINPTQFRSGPPAGPFQQPSIFGASGPAEEPAVSLIQRIISALMPGAQADPSGRIIPQLKRAFGFPDETGGAPLGAALGGGLEAPAEVAPKAKSAPATALQGNALPISTQAVDDSASTAEALRALATWHLSPDRSAGISSPDGHSHAGAPSPEILTDLGVRRSQRSR